MDKVKIMNIDVLDCTIDELMDYTKQSIDDRCLRRGTGVNLNQLYLLKNNSEFANSVKKCDILIPDGEPVMWIAKWLGSPLKSKITGPEYTLRLFQLAADYNYKIFILGGKPGSAELAIENISKIYPNLPKPEYYCPPFGFEKDEDEINKIIEKLKHSKSDMLIMALGAPKQENFAEKYYREFQIPIIFGSGIAIDYYAGRVKKAPILLNKMGLEWLFRLVQEPKRLFRRYIIDDLPFLLEMKKWARNEKKKRKGGQS